MKILLPLAAMAAGFLVTPSAYAQESRLVRVSDLRLDTAEGVKLLDRRIRSAARAVCQPPADYARSQKVLAMRCEKETIAAVTPQRAAAIAAIQPSGGIQLSGR